MLPTWLAHIFIQDGDWKTKGLNLILKLFKKDRF